MTQKMTLLAICSSKRLWLWGLIAGVSSGVLVQPLTVVAQSATSEPTGIRWQAPPVAPAPVGQTPPVPGVQVANPPAPLNNSLSVEPLPVPPPSTLISDLGSGMSLGELVQIASENHPQLRRAAENYKAAQGQAVQVGLYPNPQLAASSPQWAGASSQYNGFVSQEIVVAHKLQLNRAAAQRQVLQAEYAFRTAWFEVLTGIRQQFYTTLVAQERVTIMSDLVSIADRSQASARKLLEVGEGSRGDVILLDIELERTRVQLANAEVYLAVNKQRLALVTGVPNLEIHKVDGDLRTRTPEYSLPQLPEEVAEVNSQVDAARTEISRNQIQLRRSKVEPIPNVFLMGGYQYQVDPAPHSQGLFQVTVEVPLFDRNQGNIRSAEANISGAVAESRRVELDLANQAAAAGANYRAAEQRVAKYEQQILPQARELLDLTQRLYVQGEIDFLRMLQAQKAIVEANLAYIAAQEDRWMAAAVIAGLLQVEQFP